MSTQATDQIWAVKLARAVRELHATRWVGEAHSYAICVECRQVWPCETVRVVGKVMND